MLENLSVVSKKTWGVALGLLFAFSAPLSGLAQDVPAHNPDGLISISGMVERASADELAIKPLTGSDVTTVKQYQGGVQTITVPADTPVNEYQLTATKPVAGDRVFLLARKAADGSFSESTGVLSGK